MYVVSREEIIPISALSSGEKQILLILLRVFLLDGDEAYVCLLYTSDAADE